MPRTVLLFSEANAAHATAHPAGRGAGAGTKTGLDSSVDRYYGNCRIKRATPILSNGEKIELTLSNQAGVRMVRLVRPPGQT